ncbi:uncharacterized skeletal organic matrix protein 5-like [Stylophora pistillata]|uniref:Fibrinogen C-terminal domain-containing protein n=1 Tax=Stylophora pistillata TaxID=50429 RepID=A0A2B4SB80_STYPI|nr:uncharacterized skeletal organic matrix protein 5-like [Stylophora pistillata]PFX25828.1 hypothetical protein AWC38_SpisGene9514 [Stylophora pistillata]
MTDTQESVVRNQAVNDHKFGFLNKFTPSEWLVLLTSATFTVIAVVWAAYHSNTICTCEDLRDAMKSLEKKLEKGGEDFRARTSEAIRYFEASFKENCGEGERKGERELDPPADLIFDSCKEIFDSKRAYGDKAFPLHVGGKQIPVYCQMTPLEGCGGGGWTMVMKIDGAKENFNYDSALWTDRKSFNTQGGETGFDRRETKLPTYWKTPFSKICVGMKVGNDQINFQVIDQLATSLHSLIADGQYRATSLGREKWKNLIGSEASLQYNCNKEGFNAKPDPGGFDYSDASKARIGIIGNNEIDCYSPESRIGFGTAGYVDKKQSCGNVGRNGADNGDKNIPVMGYILVQ